MTKAELERELEDAKEKATEAEVKIERLEEDNDKLMEEAEELRDKSGGLRDDLAMLSQSNIMRSFLDLKLPRGKVYDEQTDMLLVQFGN